MIPRIVEISSPGRYIKAERGHLVVCEKNNVVGRVPLNDVGVLLIATPAASISAAVLSRLAAAGAISVICGEDFRPAGLVWPTSGHHYHQKRLALQIAASQPFKKRLWQSVVQYKIKNQAWVLQARLRDCAPVLNLVNKVTSGDKENREALAARLYWNSLFDRGFRRNTSGNGINAMLNYGYAILRAGTARAVAASGLHPAFGIHHNNLENPFCLIDDLLEPYRPIVDYLVRQLLDQQVAELNSDSKKQLASLLHFDVLVNGECSTVSNALILLAQSLIRSFETKSNLLTIANLWDEQAQRLSA